MTQTEIEYTPPDLKLVKAAQTPQRTRRALRWQASIRRDGRTAAEAFVRLCYKLYLFKEMELYRDLDPDASFDSWLRQPENKIGRSTGHLAVQIFGMCVRDLQLPYRLLLGVDKVVVPHPYMPEALEKPEFIFRQPDKAILFYAHEPRFRGEPSRITQRKFAAIAPVIREAIKEAAPHIEDARHKVLDLLWQATHEAEDDIDLEGAKEWETLYNQEVPINTLFGFQTVRDVLSFIGINVGLGRVVITVKRKRG